MSTISDLLANGGFLVILAIIMRGILAYQRGLTYTEYRTAHKLKCTLFQILDPITSERFNYPLVYDYGPPDEEDEFLRSIEESPKTVAKKLWSELSGHLPAGAKRRKYNGEWQWSHVQMVYVHEDDDKQTEFWLFPNDECGTDVYAHYETVVTDPDGHLYDEQEMGDPEGVFNRFYSG